MSAQENEPLKEIFNAERFRFVAKTTASIYPDFDQKRFLNYALNGLDELSLLQRLRRMTEALHETLPSDYSTALEMLRKLAPLLAPSFVCLVLSDYVALYGRADYERSLAALKYFTVFGSSEFAIREFLRQDLPRTLAVMETWSRDENEAVRRLASEGCRPRLPWSFRLEALLADPSPVAPILENLKADPSLFVRKSVANHLNDITKDHPEWVLERVQQWPLDNPRTAWIVRHALRTLIKKGDRRALTIVGAGRKAKLAACSLSVKPASVRLGQDITLSLQLTSGAAQTQRLEIDYAVHYVKKSGSTFAKVFKWKRLSLAGREQVKLVRKQSIRNFTTRTHHPGTHQIDVFINGTRAAQGLFTLRKSE